MFIQTYFLGPVKISWDYLKSSKTLIFNFILGLAGAIEAYSGFLRGLFLSDETFGVFMVVIATIGAMLRFVTSRSLRSKVSQLDKGDV
jgi:uncharacterized membrane protein YeaQ/YmgE (transglycosylase-associated protein family)